MSSENKKNANLKRHLGLGNEDSMKLVKLTRLMSIFTSKKVRKILIQIQRTKSNPKITRGGKSTLPDAN